MSVVQMREALKRAPKYNHTHAAKITWAYKVDQMTDRQVIAIYHRMLKGGELDAK